MWKILPKEWVLNVFSEVNKEEQFEGVLLLGINILKLCESVEWTLPQEQNGA